MSARLRYVPLLASDLRAMGACVEQVALFAKRYPNGATADDVTDALSAGLLIEWLVYALCDATAWAEYERVTAPALAEYQRVRAPAWADMLYACWPVWEGDQ